MDWISWLLLVLLLMLVLLVVLLLAAPIPLLSPLQSLLCHPVAVLTVLTWRPEGQVQLMNNSGTGGGGVLGKRAEKANNARESTLRQQFLAIGPQEFRIPKVLGEKM